jgi:hypothetical protein
MIDVKKHDYDPGCRCTDCCRDHFRMEYPKAQQSPVQRSCNHFLFDAWCGPARELKP